MRGSIRERRPGVWEVRAYVGVNAGGKPVQKSRTVRGGRRKAEDELRRLQGEVKRGRHRPGRGTLAHLMERYFAHLEAQGRSPSTLRGYRSKFRAHIGPELGALDVDAVTPDRLDDFYSKLRGLGLANRTVQQHHAILSGALQHAYKKGWVESNMARRASPPGVPQSHVAAPTVDDVHRLLALAEQRNPTLAAFLFVAVTTGARRGELCALRWSAVDLDRATVVINSSVVELGKGKVALKGTKNERGARLALDGATVEVLRRHRLMVDERAADGGIRLVADPFVFSRQVDGSQPYKPDLVTGFFGRLRDDLGLPDVVLHHLRHFMATQALAAGVDVRTVAGRLRNDPAVTMNVYGHLLEERDRATANVIGELLRPKDADQT